MIESSDAETNDSTGTYTGFVTYRLTGDKKALKQMKQDHDGHVDIVTGILKSDLPQQNTPQGKRVGNTRITVGAGRSRRTIRPLPNICLHCNSRSSSTPALPAADELTS